MKFVLFSRRGAGAQRLFLQTVLTANDSGRLKQPRFKPQCNAIAASAPHVQIHFFGIFCYSFLRKSLSSVQFPMLKRFVLNSSPTPDEILLSGLNEMLNCIRSYHRRHVLINLNFDRIAILTRWPVVSKHLDMKKLAIVDNSNLILIAVVRKRFDMHIASNFVPKSSHHLYKQDLLFMHPSGAIGAPTACRSRSAPNTLVLSMSVAMFACGTVRTSTAIGQ